MVALVAKSRRTWWPWFERSGEAGTVTGGQLSSGIYGTLYLLL